MFGNQSDSDEAFGWMNGYDKWNVGMFNRMANIAHIPVSVGIPEGREAVKKTGFGIIMATLIFIVAA